jgi:hypothetical protein
MSARSSTAGVTRTSQNRSRLLGFCEKWNRSCLRSSVVAKFFPRPVCTPAANPRYQAIGSQGYRICGWFIRLEAGQFERSLPIDFKKRRDRRADRHRRGRVMPSSRAAIGRSRLAPLPIRVWRARSRKAPALRRRTSSAPPPWHCLRRRRSAARSSIVPASPICQPAQPRAPASTSTTANCPASSSGRTAPDGDLPGVLYANRSRQ